MTKNNCKCCNGEGRIDDYNGNTIRCPLCGWPIAKCHGDSCDEREADTNNPADKDCQVKGWRTWGGTAE